MFLRTHFIEWILSKGTSGDSLIFLCVFSFDVNCSIFYWPGEKYCRKSYGALLLLSKLKFKYRRGLGTLRFFSQHQGSMNVKKHLILNLNRNELKSRLLTNRIDLFSDKKITCMNIYFCDNLYEMSLFTECLVICIYSMIFSTT